MVWPKTGLQVHSFFNHTAAKPKPRCLPELSLQYIISNAGDSADTVDIYGSAKLSLLVVSFFPNIHTKSSLPHFKPITSCFTHRGHKESVILFLFAAAFNKFESCSEVSFGLLFRVNNPNISVYHMQCFLDISTMSTPILKYCIALKLERVFKLRLSMQREKLPSDLVYETLWSLLFLCNIVCLSCLQFTLTFKHFSRELVPIQLNPIFQ